MTDIGVQCHIFMNHKTIRIGLYGKGYWASVLREKIRSLGDKYSIVFEADSKNTRLNDDDLQKIDWAFVATPHETHFEIVEICLRAGINVFCEKPLSTSIHEVRRLYQLADENKLCLYVDDVFVWRDQFQQLTDESPIKSEAIWHKSDGKPLKGLRLAKDLAYHHIYMLGSLYNYPSFSCEVDEFTSGLEFRIKLDNKYELSMSYSKNAPWSKNEFLGMDFSKHTNDALMSMLEYVLSLQNTPDSNKTLVLWTTQVLHAVTTSSNEKVAVIGGGIFGCTAALDLAKNGYDVTLFEAEGDLIQGATLKNQLRLHRGYHYPRSDETAIQCRLSEHKFNAYFRPAIDDSVQHYYAIASHDSKVTPEQYESFMKKHGLEYKKISNNAINGALKAEAITSIYAVKEYSYNPHRLKDYLTARCKEEGVNIKLDERIESIDTLRGTYNKVVAATYASPLLDVYGEMQFEICEKPVVRLPERFRGLSMVILDGPFVSLDPYSADPSLHLIGSVDDAIHLTNIGLKPEIPVELIPYINNGLVINPKVTKIEDFRIRFTSLYNLGMEEIEHIGSYFMIRAVEAHRDSDDRRISVLQEVSRDVYNIFSAKVTSAPLISQQLVRQFETEPLL